MSKYPHTQYAMERVTVFATMRREKRSISSVVRHHDSYHYCNLYFKFALPPVEAQWLSGRMPDS